jgi:repressor LexA
MNRPLTSGQKKVLSTIADLTHKKGTPPSMEELRVALNLSSVSSVQRHTEALKEKGYLENSRGISFPEPTDKVQIPLVGNVACGLPLLATENIEAYISFDASRIHGRAEDYFFLRAVGDSMNKASIDGNTIDDGDFVLIRKQSNADFGSRVVALIGDEATIKRLAKGDEGYRLEPESTNPANKPIYLFQDFSIQGIVTNVIKKGGDNHDKL